MAQHILEKINKRWQCPVCQRKWASKPKSGCLGVPVRDWGCVAPDEITSREIGKMDLQIKEGVKEIAARTTNRERVVDWIYKRGDVTIRATEPPVISWEDKEANGYLTIGEMNKALVRPIANADTKRLPLWDKVDQEWSYIIAVKRSDCEPCEKPNFLTRGQVVEEFKFNPVDRGLPPAQVSVWHKGKRDLLEVTYYDRRIIEGAGLGEVL